MELSNIVAIMVSLIYLPLGIALLTGQLKGKELVAGFKKSPGLQLIIGCFGVIIGTILVIFHNSWVKDWRIVITIFGWIALIESVLLLALPKTMFSITKVIPKNEKLWGIITIILGLIFGYFGFFA